MRPSLITRALACAALLAAAAVSAQAASVTFNNVADSVVRGGAYTGFYSLTIDAETLLAMCDSRYSVVNQQSGWTADLWDHAAIQAGAVGKFNVPSSAATLARYAQAGWLFSQVATLAPNDYDAQADIQEAIWKIMTPAYALVGTGASAWHAAATGGLHDSFDWSGVMRVLTPSPLQQNGLDIQEFLVGPGTTVTPVPAPAAAWLLGSAVAGLALLRRRA